MKSQMRPEDYFRLAGEACGNALDLVRAARVLQQQGMFPQTLALVLFGYEELGKGLLWLGCSIRPDLAEQANPFSQKRQHVYKLQAFHMLIGVLQTGVELVETEPIGSALQKARDLMGSDTDLSAAISFLADGNQTVLRSCLEALSHPDFEMRAFSSAETIFALRSQLLYVDSLSSTPTQGVGTC